MGVKPRYPIYVPTKGRSDAPLTINMFLKDDVDFHIVVEPQEVVNYEKFGRHGLLVLPENNKGLVYARNWIRDHSVSRGFERHWQFDDDVRQLKRVYKGFRINITCPYARHSPRRPL